MTVDQAKTLVVQLAANWSAPKWSPEKFDLFVKALLPLPFRLSAAHVAHLIRTRGRFECPVVAEVIQPVERRHQTLLGYSQDRLLLREAKDPKIAALLRTTIERIEQRIKAAAT